jgi:predicted branched-subunit amino acid permease
MASLTHRPSRPSAADTVRRTAAGDGVRDAVTVIVAYVPFALALGAAMASTRVDPLVAWSSSFLVFAGAAQLVSVQLLSDGSGAVIVVLTALVVNSRHLLYSASLSPHTRTWGRGARRLSAYFLADPVYALAIARFESRENGGDESRLRYYLAMAITLWAGWVALTGAGGLLAGLLPEDLPLQLAAPLTFLLLLLPTLKSRASYVAAAAAGLVALAASALPLGVGMLLAAVVGVGSGALIERTRHA